MLRSSEYLFGQRVNLIELDWAEAAILKVKWRVELEVNSEIFGTGNTPVEAVYHCLKAWSNTPTAPQPRCG
jgi:hypothetical protein